MEPKDVEALERKRVKDVGKYIERVAASGFWGKASLIMLYAAFATPFVFNLVAIWLVWMLVWPSAQGVSERIAVLGFLFLILNAVAYQIRNFANSAFYVAFMSRKKR